MSILLKGGRVVTAAGDYVADVFVADGRIARIGASLEVDAERTIDATGKYVLPGGVDPHTHLDMPADGTSTCDDFTSGTVAAAFGGTTTIVDFCIQQRGEGVRASLERWHEKIERAKPVVDVGFHVAVTDLRAGNALAEIASLPEAGVTSIKVFMAYDDVMLDDEALFRTMLVAGETGALVLVHAENGPAINVLVERALAAGRVEPWWHGATRPPETEAEATNRAIHLARLAGCPLYVVHVSCAAALGPLERARAAGWRVWGETCPQYLFMDESRLAESGFEGAKYVFTPPPRRDDDRARLWSALGSGLLSVVSTDHCPFSWKDQKTLGRRDFTKIPNGAPGIENRLHMLHHFGVGHGRLTLPRLVELVSTAPARLFGLYPRKGTVAPGSDADLVVFDPERRVRISAESHHSRVDYNLFEGTEVSGAPEVVLLRGRVIVEDDRLVGEPGAGEFVKRARFGEPLHAAFAPAAAGAR